MTLIQVTVNAMALTVGLLPSVPVTQAYQVPVVAGVGTYAPHRFVFTKPPAVQLVGATVADVEKPNCTDAVEGVTCALTAITPLPCV